MQTPPPGILDRHALGLALIQEAGALALRHFRSRDRLTITAKGLQDMVSEADLEVELLIRRRIGEAFPEDAFLGEETEPTPLAPDQGVWVVDPIDGTQPFLSGLSSWCISIAFVRGNTLLFGLVLAPARDELFSGGIGIPATLNGRPVARHPGQALTQGICGFGHSPRVSPDRVLPVFERFLRAGGMFYRSGSGALMLCDVAAGRLIGYVELHINSWDCLGAIAVIRAAGLSTNDFLADDGLHKGNPVIAAPDPVFPTLEAVLRG